ELGLDQRQRQRRADQRDVGLETKEVGNCPDVVLVAVSEHDRLDVVKAVLDVLEVRQDQVDAGVVVLGEEHSTVDDQQSSGVLDDGHVAADLAQTTERDDAQGVPRQLGRRGQLGMGMDQVSPDCSRPSRTRASWSLVAAINGRRTASEAMSPRWCRAALTAIAPWVMVMTALTAGMSCRWISMARARLPWPTAATISTYCGPATWPTTLTMPDAPCVRWARLRRSSPEYHCRSVFDMTSLAANRSPLASLTATMRGCSASLSKVWG